MENYEYSDSYNLEKSDQDIEVHQKNDKISLIKENNSLKYELQVWEHAYYEIIRIFGCFISISEETAKTSIDKQNTLVKLCRDVVKTIDDPDNLIEKLRIQNELLKNSKKKQKKKKNNINPEIFLKNKPYIDQLVSSKLTNRLHDIDVVLSKEIERNKKYLNNQNQAKAPRKLASENQKKEKPNFPQNSDRTSPPFNEKSKKDYLQIARYNNYDTRIRKKSNEQQFTEKNQQINSVKTNNFRKNKRKTVNYQYNGVKRPKK